MTIGTNNSLAAITIELVKDVQAGDRGSRRLEESGHALMTVPKE
jgi:hypothetical protein